MTFTKLQKVAMLHTTAGGGGGGRGRGGEGGVAGGVGGGRWVAEGAGEGGGVLHSATILLMAWQYCSTLKPKSSRTDTRDAALHIQKCFKKLYASIYIYIYNIYINRPFTTERIHLAPRAQSYGSHYDSQHPLLRFTRKWFLISKKCTERNLTVHNRG